MSVKAWTDAYNPPNKFLYGSKPYYRTKHAKDGSVTQTRSGSTGHTLAYANREAHSSNPVTTSWGFPWRDQSSYRRWIMESTYKSADYKLPLSSGRYYRYTGQPVATSSRRTYLLTYPVGGAYEVLSTDEINRAVTECLLRLKDGKVNLGNMLAESVKSVNMVADTASELWSLLLAIKRGRLPKRSIFNPTLSGANQYLRYKYGWKPLMSDLYSLYKGAQDGLAQTHQMMSAVRNVSKNYSTSSNVQYWINRQQTVNVIATCKLWARLSDAFIANANQYGLVNPASLAWELIPFSFVVDWGIPIGNFLESLNASAGLTFVGGYKGVRGEGVASGDVAISGVTGTLPRVEYKFLSYERSALNSFPTPVPYGKSPFSTGNTLSALALLRQLV